METGKWANLLMAVSGIVAAYASRSDALLVDGLYSGVNFVSAIIAARISIAVSRPADRRYPFGYDAYEALYVKYRSLVLIGIMAFAVFGALSKIVTYLSGGQVPELVFGPILIYSVVMITICFTLAFWHRYNWKRSGSRSDILKTESRAAVVDGIISAGAGGGLLSAALLRGTSLAPVVPVADSIVVLILCLVIAKQPIAMYVGSLREVAGSAAPADVIAAATSKTKEILGQQPIAVLDVAVTKLGRSYFVVPYLKPEEPMQAGEVDALRRELEASYTEILGVTKTEIILTAELHHEGNGDSE